MIQTAIEQALRQNNGTVTPKIASQYGINRMALSRMTAAGTLERVGRGIYVDPAIFDDEMYNLQLRFRRGIYARETALFLHGLTDRTPLLYQMTFPNSYHAQTIKEFPIAPTQQIERLYKMGVTSVKSPGDHFVKVYNIERTLCDIVRAPGMAEQGIIVQAMRQYVARPDKNITRLSEYAKELRVEGRIDQYMEVLL